jgi:hypothetical protein
MKDDLKEILLAILKRQHEAAAFSSLILADLETLTLMFRAMHPEAVGLLEKALLANRDKFAQERDRIQAEIELLKATVSKLVH